MSKRRLIMRDSASLIRLLVLLCVLCACPRLIHSVAATEPTSTDCTGNRLRAGISSCQNITEARSAKPLPSSLAEAAHIGLGHADQQPSVSQTKGLSTFYSSRLYRVWTEALGNRKGDPHKPFFPLDKRDLIAFVFASVALFVAAGGGIGGGGVLVPVFILVLGKRLVAKLLPTSCMPVAVLQDRYRGIHRSIGAARKLFDLKTNTRGIHDPIRLLMFPAGLEGCELFVRTGVQPRLNSLCDSMRAKNFSHW